MKVGVEFKTQKSSNFEMEKWLRDDFKSAWKFQSHH